MGGRETTQRPGATPNDGGLTLPGDLCEQYRGKFITVGVALRRGIKKLQQGERNDALRVFKLALECCDIALDLHLKGGSDGKSG